MPRRRGVKTRDLPPNLHHTVRRDGRLYFEYKRPSDGKRVGLGYDRAEAIGIARECNAFFAGSGNRLARAMGSPGRTTLGEYVKRYRDEILPQRKIKGQSLSKRTLVNTEQVLDRIVEGLGAGRAMRDISQRDLAEYLRGIESAASANDHRSQMMLVWRYATSDQVVEANLPERIVKRDMPRRARQRLTVAQYTAIYAKAGPAIQNAMELSLNSLQRRTDIHKWRFDDQADGFAHVVQSKTRKHGPSAFLRIPLSLPTVHSEAGSRTLGDIIARCRDSVICPFLIHKHAGRRAEEKEHLFQLTVSAISRGFADARQASGLFNKTPREQQPTFHELISLGQHLREKQGWNTGQIKTLRGHTSEAMTQHYLDGHEWTVVHLPKSIKG